MKLCQIIRNSMPDGFIHGRPESERIRKKQGGVIEIETGRTSTLRNTTAPRQDNSRRSIRQRLL